MFSELTHTQVEVLKLNAVGLSSCEIADKMDISEETAKTHIKNIKLRTGYQKITELTAYYWCELFGTSLDEQRRSILTSAMCLIFLCTLPIDNEDKRRIRIRYRNNVSQRTSEIPTVI